MLVKWPVMKYYLLLKNWGVFQSLEVIFCFLVEYLFLHWGPVQILKDGLEEWTCVCVPKLDWNWVTIKMTNKCCLTLRNNQAETASLILQNNSWCVCVLKFKEMQVSEGLRTSSRCLHLHYLMFQNVKGKIKVTEYFVWTSTAGHLYFLYFSGSTWGHLQEPWFAEFMKCCVFRKHFLWKI